MKKSILLILILLMILSMFGCGQQSDELKAPVHFYYLIDFTSQDDFDSVIVPEIRESAGFSDEALLNLYLQGPISDDQGNPFPDGLSIDYLRKQGNKTVMILSDELLELSGLDLTLACACLAATAFEICNCQSIEIIVNGHLIEGKASIVITRDDLVLYDESYSPQSE